MQRSQYSEYDEYYKKHLETFYKMCQLTRQTDIKQPLTSSKTNIEPLCASSKIYDTKDGDTCDSIGLPHKVSAMAVLDANKSLIWSCNHIKRGIKLCLPFLCERVHRVQKSDNCDRIEKKYSLKRDSITAYNPWISANCQNLQSVADSIGAVVCISPQGGYFKGYA